MTSRHLVDKQLVDFFDRFPRFTLNDYTVEAIRALDAAMIKTAETLPKAVMREEMWLPNYTETGTVRALLYRPVGTTEQRGAYLHIHGGGMVLGKPEQSDIANIELCETLGIVILSVDYRLAPKNPFPAALHDCYAALAYLHENAKVLDVDTKRIAIGGESAGGGLAASLAIFARDKKQYAISHLHLIYPMLDNQTGKNGIPDNSDIGEFYWTRENNQYGWNAYLTGADPAEAYVPMATSDLSNLPPTWIGVGDLDLFLPENLAFAEKLKLAGVDAEIETYSGAPHAFNIVRDTDVSKLYMANFKKRLAHKIGGEGIATCL